MLLIHSVSVQLLWSDLFCEQTQPVRDWCPKCIWCFWTLWRKSNFSTFSACLLSQLGIIALLEVNYLLQDLSTENWEREVWGTEMAFTVRIPIRDSIFSFSEEVHAFTPRIKQNKVCSEHINTINTYSNSLSISGTMCEYKGEMNKLKKWTKNYF